MRLHGGGSNVVILIPETADLLGCREVAGLVGRIPVGRMPSPRHRGLTTMRTVFSTPVMGNLNRSKRVNGSPS